MSAESDYGACWSDEIGCSCGADPQLRTACRRAWLERERERRETVTEIIDRGTVMVPDQDGNTAELRIQRVIVEPPPETRLREAILKAAEDAGGEGGIVGYLRKHAKTNPKAAALLGGVLQNKTGRP